MISALTFGPAAALRAATKQATIADLRYAVLDASARSANDETDYSRRFQEVQERVDAAFLVFVGFVVGMFGTLVGAGGGFLMLPVLLTVMHYPAAEAAGTTQLFVLANAGSGSIRYCYQGQVNVRLALTFSAFAIPGLLVGASVSGAVPSRIFEQIFAVLLLAVAGQMLYLQFFSRRFAPLRDVPDHRRGMWLMGILAAPIGLVAGLFGIGGGPLQVPVFVNIFRLPVHAAMATSVLILAITAVFGAAFHAAYGHVLLFPALAASVGGVLGSQVAAPLSQRIKSKPLVIMFAIAVVCTTGRLLVAA